MSKLIFSGAARTVTGSRTILQNNKQCFMVDCGLFQGPKPIREKNWEPIEHPSQINAMILTHAHIDHTGLIPVFWKYGYRGPIYASRATVELCKIMLPDAGKLQEEDAGFANRTKYSTHDPALPLYTLDDAERSLELLRPLEYNQWLDLNEQLKFRFIRSGHILGPAFVDVHQTDERGLKRILFSGDVGNSRSLVLKDAEPVAQCDELILESTYGDRTQPRVDVLATFGEVINRVIGRKGTLLIPAFSVGRTQEILYMIEKLRQTNSIPDIPVFVDSPMSQRATTVYQNFHDELKTEVDQGQWRSVGSSFRFISVESPDESMFLCLDPLPKIVISAAGMLNGGRILHHLKTKLPDPKSGVLFVGYQVPGTKGYLLKNQIGKIRIHHTLVDVEAEIVSIDALSAHADSDDLVKWVGDMKEKPRVVYLNHGELPAQEALKYRLETELGMAVAVKIPEEGQEFDV